MDLLPTIIIFVVVALVLVGVFSLISFIYFRMKRKRLNLNEEFNPDDNINDPYEDKLPIIDRSHRFRPKDNHSNDRITEMMTPTNRLHTQNINLSNFKNSRASTPINILTINNLRSSTATLPDAPLLDEKYIYISKLVNYNKEGLELSLVEVPCIRSTKVFKNLKWENHLVGDPEVTTRIYNLSQENFSDLLDIFKLEENSYKAVKFTVEVTIRNCQDDKRYYLDQLPKLERVETISEEEYKALKKDMDLI